MLFFRICEFGILILIGLAWANSIEKTKDEKFGDDVEWP
jgi:hypothetical protein